MRALATFRQWETRIDRHISAWLDVSLGFTSVLPQVMQKYLLGVVCVVAVFALPQKDAIEVHAPFAVVGLFHFNHWGQMLTQRRKVSLASSAPTEDLRGVWVIGTFQLTLRGLQTQASGL